jgi:hypothetical protein
VIDFVVFIFRRAKLDIPLFMALWGDYSKVRSILLIGHSDTLPFPSAWTLYLK